MQRRFLQIVFFVALLLSKSVAAAVQPPQSIEAAAMAYLTSLFDDEKYPPEIKLRPVDPRLQFPMCERPLDVIPADNIRNGGRSTINIKCTEETRPWSVYVTANISLTREVAVFARHVPRGARLSRSDLEMETKSVRTILGNYFQDIDAAVGLEAKTNLSKGSIATPRLLNIPDFVKRGQRVNIIANTGGFSVSAAGTALNSAARNERVRVRNLSSGRIVEGHASKPDTVSIN